MRVDPVADHQRGPDVLLYRPMPIEDPEASLAVQLAFHGSVDQTCHRDLLRGEGQARPIRRATPSNGPAPRSNDLWRIAVAVSVTRLLSRRLRQTCRRLLRKACAPVRKSTIAGRGVAQVISISEGLRVSAFAWPFTLIVLGRRIEHWAGKPRVPQGRAGSCKRAWVVTAHGHAEQLRFPAPAGANLSRLRPARAAPKRR